jgi:hypothetical protein
MRRHELFDSLISLETLDLRISPTSLSLGAAVPLSVVSQFSAADDPLPCPEPSPGPYPGTNPPVDHPELPPSGPVGPGSSWN